MAKAVRLARRMAEGGVADDDQLAPLPGGPVARQPPPASFARRGDPNPLVESLMREPSIPNPANPPSWAREAVVGAARPILDAGQWLGGVMAGNVEPTLGDAVTNLGGAALAGIGPPGAALEKEAAKGAAKAAPTLVDNLKKILGSSFGAPSPVPGAAMSPIEAALSHLTPKEKAFANEAIHAKQTSFPNDGFPAIVDYMHHNSLLAPPENKDKVLHALDQIEMLSPDFIASKYLKGHNGDLPGAIEHMKSVLDFSAPHPQTDALHQALEMLKKQPAAKPAVGETLPESPVKFQGKAYETIPDEKLLPGQLAAREIEQQGGWTLDSHVPPPQALAAGFDQPAFHSTAKFKGQRLGKSVITDKVQFYSTPDPELAALYASEEWAGFDPDKGLPQTLPLLLKTRDYHRYDAAGKTWQNVNDVAISQAMKKKAPGVRIDNVWDEPNTMGVLSEPKTVFITLQGHTARSRFAKFDPANMHLNDLLASGAAIAVPASALAARTAGQQQEEGMAEGGVPKMAQGGDDLPDAPWAQPKAPADLPDAPWAAAKPLSVGEKAADIGKGLLRGFTSGVGTLADAAAGPFGTSGGLSTVQKMHDLPEPTAEDLKKYGSRANYARAKLYTPGWGEDLAAAAGVPAPEKTTLRGTVAEFVGNPISYFGPAGWTAKMLMAAASGAGSEVAGQATKGSAWEPWARMAGAAAAGPLAARVVKPALGPQQQMLSDAGVSQMTPGQLFPGPMSWFKTAEDAAASIPLLGSFIQGGRQRSIQSFNQAVANQALESVGESLARGTRAGHPAVAEVEQKLSSAYDNLLPNLRYIPDRQFAVDMNAIRTGPVARMPDTTANQFERIVDNILGPPAPMDGRMLKSIESELTTLAGQHARSPLASEQQLGAALQAVNRAIRSNLERSNPMYADELQRINTGWAMFARIRDAAARRPASEGVFTPNDLLNAIKRGDKSVGRGSFARGDALMQTFAEAGQHVLPSTLSTSGTSERLAAMGVLGGTAKIFHEPHLLTAGAAAAAPYTRPGMWALGRYARPTTGPRAAYADAAQGALPPLRSVLATPFGARNPYSPDQP